MIRLVPDMFHGSNGAALLAAFRHYVAEGVILSDISMTVEPSTFTRRVTIGWCRASEMHTTKVGGPRFDGSFEPREHSGPRYELILKMSMGNSHLDTDLLVAKLAMLRG